MKKIFLSLLFLLFISVSTNAFAACSGPSIDAAMAGRVCPGISNSTCLAVGGGSVCRLSTGTTPACESALTSPSTVECVSLSDSQCATMTAFSCGILVSSNADNNALVTVLCNALSIVQGNGGKAFAAFAIISVGIGFFTGKVSWGLMIGVTAGIAAMFGATSIVGAISGKEVIDCGTGTTSL